jgi:hypothetical protein
MLRSSAARTVLAFALCASLAGCATTQLAHSTVDVAGTIENIEVAQAVENFGRFTEQPGAMPSMVALTGGTVQVVNTITPSVTFPLSHMFVRTVSATPSAATTTAGGASTLSGTVTWQQNFNIAPVNDPFVLRNLAALFRAVVHCDPNHPGESLYAQYQPPRVYSRDDELVPDPYYLAKPNCILCMVDPAKPPEHDSEIAAKTKPNAEVFGVCWLFTERDEGPKARYSDRKYIGSSDGYRFWVYNTRYEAFSEFLILLLQPSAAPARFASISAAKPAAAAGAAGDKKHQGHHGAKPGETVQIDDVEPYFILPRLAPGPAEGAKSPSQNSPQVGIQNNPQ